MSKGIYGPIVQLVDMMPDEETRTRCSSAVRLRERALAALGAGNIAEAIASAEKGAAIAPDIQEAAPVKGLCLGIKAMALCQSGRYADSLASGSQSIRYLKDHPPFANELATALNVHGGAHLGAGNPAASIPYLERAKSIWEPMPGNERKVSDCHDNLRLARSLVDRQEGRELLLEGLFWAVGLLISLVVLVGYVYYKYFSE